MTRVKADALSLAAAFWSREMATFAKEGILGTWLLIFAVFFISICWYADSSEDDDVREGE